MNFGQEKIVNKTLMHKLFYSLIFIFFTSHSFASVQVVKVCFLDIGFGKYSNRELTGLWQKKIIYALKKSNGKLEPSFTPRERCVNDLKTNSVNAIIAAYSSEHTSFITFPTDKKNEPDKTKLIGSVKYYIYKHKDSAVEWDGKLLNNNTKKNVGVQRWLYSKQIFENKGILKFEEVNTVEQGIEKVSHQRNEVFIAEELQADKAVERLKNKNVVKIPTPFYQYDLYVAFTKKFYEEKTAFVETFWKELAKLNSHKDFQETSIDLNSNELFIFSLNDQKTN